MYYNDTDHARNLLDRDAIVYCDAFGQTIRLTREDFENEDEFTKWKNISDNDYHKTEKKDLPYRKRTISIHTVADWRFVVPATEDLMIEFITELERAELRALLMQGYSECLTETQQRRLWMYCVDGLDECEIAGIEGVGQPRICNSITTAKNKLKFFLKKRG